MTNNDWKDLTIKEVLNVFRRSFFSVKENEITAKSIVLCSITAEVIRRILENYPEILSKLEEKE